jgi:hypothetical protein
MWGRDLIWRNTWFSGWSADLSAVSCESAHPKLGHDTNKFYVSSLCIYEKLLYTLNIIYAFLLYAFAIQHF